MAAGVNFFEGSVYVYDKVAAPRVRAVRGGLSGPILPATGQTTAYTADKHDGIAGAVAVPDDGTLQTGAPLSFTDNLNGTITGNTTGLVWEKKSDDGGLHDKDNYYYWTGNSIQETLWDWVEDLNTQIFGGFQDWRIPNARELLSIAVFQGPAPAVPAAFNGWPAIAAICSARIATVDGAPPGRNTPQVISPIQMRSKLGRESCESADLLQRQPSVEGVGPHVGFRCPESTW